MHKRTLLRVAPGLCIALALTIGVRVAFAGNKPGNSVNAKMCQKDGWKSLYTRTGEPFASEQACTSYGAKGGQLINEAALACLNDGWKTLGPDATTTFATEQECVSSGVGGGTLVAFVDVRLGFENSEALMCDGLGDGGDLCVSEDIRLYNDGAIPVTVNFDIDDTYVQGSALSTSFIPNPTMQCSGPIGGGTVDQSCTVTNLQPGSIFVGRLTANYGGSHVGSASVTSSSSPDPDTSNNSLAWNLVAPSQ
jgi:hypothetical protein